MTQVVLIRSGATLYDEQNRVQGVLDLPLTERGRSEVAALADRLATLPLQAVYHGPGESIVRTAEAVARAVGLRAKRVDELRNMDLGLWQGLQVEEIKRRNSKVYRQWIEEPETVCPPQGETVHEALERLKTALKPLIRRHRDAMIGLVAAEPLCRLIAGCLGRPARVPLEFHVPTGDFVRIEVSPEWSRNGDGH